MSQTTESTHPSAPSALEAAVQAASQQPTDSTLWDAAEDLVSETETPEPLADLYAEVLGRDLGAPALRELSERALRFTEEWFSDEAPRALAVLKRVFARNPRDETLLERLAMGLTSAGKWADLMDVYDQALDATDSLEEKAKMLAEAARVAKDVAEDVDRAVDYLERLLPLRPHDAQLRQSLERLLEKEKRWSQLIDLWESGLEDLSPDEAATQRVRIAQCWLERLHNPPAAVDVLVAAAEQYGDHEAICAALEHVCSLEDASRPARSMALGCVRDLYREADRGGDLARVLRVGIGFEEGEAREGLLRELIGTLRDLGEGAEVLQRVGQLFEARPDDDELLAEVGAAASAEGDQASHVDILLRASEATQDEARRDTLALKAAEVAVGAGLSQRGAEIYARIQDGGSSEEVRRTAGTALVALLREHDHDPAMRQHALEALAEITEDAEQQSALLGELARLAAEQGDHERALATWQRRLDRDAADAEALDGLIDVLRAAERWKPLVQALRRRVEQRSDDAAACARDLADLASIQVGPLGDLEAALGTWRELAGVDADTLAQTGGNEIATRNASAAFTQAATLQVAVADALRDVWGDLSGAADHYARALSMDPAHSGAQAGLGHVLEDEGLRPLAAEALGRAYRDTGNVDGQLQVLEARVQSESDPRKRRALWLQAATLSEGDKGDLAGAFEQMCQAFLCLPADPGCDDDLERLAEATESTQRYADVLTQAREALPGSSRRVALTEREAGLREIGLEQLEPALALYDELHTGEAGRENWAHSACRLALALEQYTRAAAVIVGHAAARDQVPRTLLELVAGEQGYPSAQLCASLEPAFHHSQLSPHVVRGLHVQLGTWCEQAGADPDLTERVWARALEAGKPDADILGHLVALRRRQPGTRLFETLMAWAELLDNPVDALREAATLAHQSLSDDTLLQQALEPLLSFTNSARGRQLDPEGARQTSSWAVALLAEVHERAQDNKALLSILETGAALEPPADDTLQFGLRAAKLSREIMQDDEAAIAAYARLFDQRPDHAETGRALVEMYEQAERNQEALVVLQRALAAAGHGEWRNELRLWIARVAGKIEANDPRVSALRDNLRDQPGHEETMQALEGVLRERAHLDRWYETLVQQAAAVRAEGGNDRAAELYRSGALVARDEMNDSKRSLAAFVEVAELAPSPEVFDAIATLHEQRQEPERASNWLTRLLESSPEDEVVRLRLAGAFEAAGDLDSAERSLRTGVRAQPESLPLRDALAGLLQRREQVRPLADLLADTARHAKDEAIMLDHARRAAKLYDELGTPELGVDMLEQATSAAPEDRPLKGLYADALIAAGRLDGARELLESMIAAYGRRRSPERAEVHLRLARVARMSGQMDEALSQLDAAAGMSRGDVSTLRALAQLAEEAGEWDRAEKALRSLMMIARRASDGSESVASSEVQYGLHRIAKARGQEEKAEELLQSAIETAAQSEPESELFKRTLLNSGEPHLLLKVLEMRLEQVVDAATEARVLADLADVLQGPLDRPKEALDARIRALTAAPTVEELHRSTRELAAQLDQLDRYTGCLQQMLERARRKEDAEEAAVVAMHLGDACEQHAGDLDTARDAYAHVAPGTSAYVDAQLGLARLAGKRGSRDEERQVLEALLSADGVSEEAQMRARYRLLELSVVDPEGRDSALDAVQDLLSQFPSSHREAAHVLGVACDADPQDGRAPALLEEVARKSEDPELLLSFFERHANSGEASLELIREGAELARELNKDDRASALYQHAARVAAAGPGGLVDALWAPVALSTMAREQGDLEGALQWLRQAAEAAEGEEGFALGIELAQLAAGQGRNELAIETYERLRLREPAERRVFRPLFSLYRDAGDLAGARELVRATTEALLGPEERNELRADLAELAFEKGDAAMAEEVLREGLDDDPEDERCALLLADHLEREGRKEDLADLLGRKLESAHERRSVSIVPLSMRMGGLLEESRPEDAVQVYRTALSIAPEDPGLLKATVSLMDPQQQAAERAQLVERLLETAPPENAPELALWLLDYAANHGGESDVERAMALGFKVAPGDESLRQRLEQWYRDREDWPKLSEMLATQAERAEDPTRAVELLREAAEIVLERLGDPVRAAEMLRGARERDPNDLELLRLAVLSSVRAGHGEQAMADLEAVLAKTRKKKKKVPLHMLRAEALADSGDPLGAIDDLEAAYSIGGDEVAERYVRGLVRARAAAEARGDSERERELLMRALEVADRVEGVEPPTAELQRWLERNPDDVQAAVQLLDRRAAEEAWPEVVSSAERIIAVGELEEVHRAAVRLMSAADALGEPQQAARGLEQGLSRFPGDAALRDQLAGIYESLGAHEHLALLLLNNLPSESEPDARFEVLRRAGRLLVAANRPADALRALEAALAVKPDDHETLLTVIDAHIESGGFEQAQSLLERSMENIRSRRSPELAELRHRMAVLCDRAGDQRARYEWLAVALEADMNNGVVASETAVLAQELGEVDTALKALRAVTMIKGDCPMSRAEAFLRQAQIVAHKGETRRAALWAKKAKAEDPDFPGVDELLAQLGG